MNFPDENLDLEDDIELWREEEEDLEDQPSTSEYTRRTCQSLIRATHRILKPNSQLPKFTKTITIAPAIFAAARTNPGVLVNFLTFCEALRTIRWWANYMHPEIQAFLRDCTYTSDVELFLFYSPNIAKNIEPFPPCFKPRLEGTIGSGGNVQSGSFKDIITTLPRIKSITDTHQRCSPPGEVYLMKGDIVGLVEELKFVSLSVSTMLRLRQARSWDNLGILHTCIPQILGTLDNAVPGLETLGLYEKANYCAPDGRAYSRDNYFLQMFRAPSLKSIAIYGAFFWNMIDFIKHFKSTIVELKLIWTEGYTWDEYQHLNRPPPFIREDELSDIGWNCLNIERLQISVRETYDELVGAISHIAVDNLLTSRRTLSICSHNSPS